MITHPRTTPYPLLDYYHPSKSALFTLLLPQCSSGFVGVSYGFLLSTVCSTTAEAMKLSIRFYVLLIIIIAVIHLLEYCKTSPPPPSPSSP